MNSEVLECFSEGDYQKGIDIAQSNGIVPTNDPYTSNVVAACLFRLGNFSDCYSLLQELESSLSDNFEYLSLYGSTARRLGYFQKSQELFSRALSINPDNPALCNNYANLLIDLQKYDESRAILDKLVREFPEYQDARVNLNRLDNILKSQDGKALSDLNSSPNSGGINRFSDSSSLPLDPLSMAFAEEEVRLHGRMKAKPPSVRSSQSLSENLPSTDNNKIAIDKLRVAEKAIAENNSDFALQLCSEALSISGPLPAIYDCAADAYIQKKMFNNAELMYLQASLLDEPTAKHFINLTTLATIRGDYALADLYIEKLSSLSPFDSHLSPLKDSLSKARGKNNNECFSF